VPALCRLEREFRDPNNNWNITLDPIFVFEPQTISNYEQNGICMQAYIFVEEARQTPTSPNQRNRVPDGPSSPFAIKARATARPRVSDLLERHTAMQPGLLQHSQQHRLHSSRPLGWMKHATILHERMLNLVLYWVQRRTARWANPNNSPELFSGASESSDLDMISSLLV
jgi:hypothetical protein